MQFLAPFDTVYSFGAPDIPTIWAVRGWRRQGWRKLLDSCRSFSLVDPNRGAGMSSFLFLTFMLTSLALFLTLFPRLEPFYHALFTTRTHAHMERNKLKEVH